MNSARPTVKINPRDKYVFVDGIGSGAMGTVYKVQSKETGIYYACKTVKKDVFQDSTDVERFQREINTMAILSHPNITALIDFFEDPDSFYIVMDLCQGGDLFEYIVDNGGIQEPIAKDIMLQIISALSYCHRRGVAHRDIKPENILFTSFPNIKITDFGMCGYIDGSIKLHTFCGSPCYCAPERLRREEYDGEKADVFSLGVTLFCMVTASFPWDVDHIQVMIQQILHGILEVPDFVSPQCKDLILSMLAVEADKRPTLEQISQHPWLNPQSKIPYCNSEKPKFIYKQATAPNSWINMIESQKASNAGHISEGLPAAGSKVTQSNIDIQHLRSVKAISQQIFDSSTKMTFGIVSPVSFPQLSRFHGQRGRLSVTVINKGKNGRAKLIKPSSNANQKLMLNNMQ